MESIIKKPDVIFVSEDFSAKGDYDNACVIATGGKSVDECAPEVVSKMLSVAKSSGYENCSIDVYSFINSNETRSFVISTFTDAFSKENNREISFRFEYEADRALAEKFSSREMFIERGFSQEFDVTEIEKGEFFRSFSEYKKQFAKDKDFYDVLNDFMFEKNLDPPKVYKAAGISRHTFSKICNPYLDYHPSKDMLCSIAIGLRLDLDETIYLLNSAQVHLGRVTIKDQVIRYCIEHKIYDIDKVNDCLEWTNCSLLNERYLYVK